MRAVGHHREDVAGHVELQARIGQQFRGRTLGVHHDGRPLLYVYVTVAVRQQVVEQPLGDRVGGQLLADHHLAEDHEALVDGALGDSGVAELLVAMGQRNRAASGLLVDVAVDDVVPGPGEEIGLRQAGKGRMFRILHERHPARVVGRREVRRQSLEV